MGRGRCREKLRHIGVEQVPRPVEMFVVLEDRPARREKLRYFGVDVHGTLRPIEITTFIMCRLSISELKGKYGPLPVDRLLLTGFYPRIYDQDLDPTQALGDYLATYVERDIRQLLAVKDLGLFEKFVRLTAGRVGRILNLNSLAGDVGISHPTARGWMTLLEASYVVFLLPPWFGNVSKRLIKSPKLYFHDVGLAGYLLGLESEHAPSGWKPFNWGCCGAVDLVAYA